MESPRAALNGEKTSESKPMKTGAGCMLSYYLWRCGEKLLLDGCTSRYETPMFN